jgi:hypothetical protein
MCPNSSVRHHSIDHGNVERSDASPCVEGLLPIEYVLGDNDVLCGRSKKCLAHPGSQKLRYIVQAKLKEYIAASTKAKKSLIIRDVVNQIRDVSTISGFVKHDPLTERYYDVGETMAVS